MPTSRTRQSTRQRIPIQRPRQQRPSHQRPKVRVPALRRPAQPTGRMAGVRGRVTRKSRQQETGLWETLTTALGGLGEKQARGKARKGGVVAVLGAGAGAVALLRRRRARNDAREPTGAPAPQAQPAPIEPIETTPAA